ncbi:hypothetical protein C8J56DRAFT_1032192, partial [Mycena floridula]
MAKRRTGTFRFFKGLKRLNRDEAELRQFQRRLYKAAQGFKVAMAARGDVLLTQIAGSTTRTADSMAQAADSMAQTAVSMAQTEVSTTRIEAQIQLSTSKLEVSNSRISHIES